MDGHFVPNITIGPGLIASLRKTTAMPFDVHLMIENPERYVDDFVRAGANQLTVHVEATAHLHRLIGQIHEKGIKAGVSVNPGTPLCLLEPVLSDIDLLLIMSVNPGFGGQKFIESSLPRIRAAKEMIKNAGSAALLEVDGGVSPTNVRSVFAAGADAVVAGAAIFGSADYRTTITSMRDLP